MTNIGDMSSIQIKLAANKLLNNNENVELGQQDLELLWEFTKQDKSLNLPADLSDEEIIAKMDALDTAENSARESYSDFKSWLKEFINPSTKAPVLQKPVVNQPNVGVPPVVIEPSKNDDIKVDEDSIALDKNTNVNINSQKPLLSNTEKQFMQLYPKGSQTVEINGKSYTISNDSKTSNNFAYYMDGETLVVEGHYLTITSDLEGDVADNIKVIGNANKIDMKQGNDQVEAEGSMNMLYAGEGEDFIKIRGDMNSVDMGTGEDTVWIAGNNNQAHGGDNVRENAINSDKFYAMGASNNLFGQDGVDAAYYNTTDAVEGEFDAGKGQELRIEEKITDGTDFENWVKGDDVDGPPYSTLPDALDGHEVRAYDDNTYTDKYEKEPVYYTEYRDIAYREMSAITTQNKETGEGTVIKYNEEDGVSKYVLNPDGSAMVYEGEYSAAVPANELVFYDENENPVKNAGSLESTLEKLATSKLFIGNEYGVIRFEKPEIIDPVPPVVKPAEILNKTEKDGIITTVFNSEVVGQDITVSEDTNNNTGKIVSGDGNSVEFAQNGDIIVYRYITGLRTSKYEPDNTEFFNPKTNETVARPEKLSDLMSEIVLGNISFKSKSVLPSEQEGHTINQVDDKYYTDSYEKDGETITDYKDLKHRTLYAQMTVNNESGDASCTKKNYSVLAEGDTTYTMDKSGNLTIKNSLFDVKMTKGEYEIKDKSGNIVENPGSPQEILYKVMTGEYAFILGTIKDVINSA